MSREVLLASPNRPARVVWGLPIVMDEAADFPYAEFLKLLDRAVQEIRADGVVIQDIKVEVSAEAGDEWSATPIVKVTGHRRATAKEVAYQRAYQAELLVLRRKAEAQMLRNRLAQLEAK